MISIHRYHDTDGLESRLIYSTVVVAFKREPGVLVRTTQKFFLILALTCKDFVGMYPTCTRYVIQVWKVMSMKNVNDSGIHNHEIAERKPVSQKVAFDCHV